MLNRKTKRRESLSRTGTFSFSLGLESEISQDGIVCTSSSLPFAPVCMLHSRFRQCAEEKETHILVFDMGGGTFDVTGYD